MSSVLLCGPLLRFGIGFAAEKLHVAPDGRFDPQASDTDSGKVPVGVTVNTYEP
jgi:hypothetical protein